MKIISSIPGFFFTSLRSEVRRRLRPYIIFVFVVWPVISFTSATVEALSNLYIPLTWKYGVMNSLGGMIILAPDFLVVGVIISILSLAIFSFSSYGKPVKPRILGPFSEPGTVMLSIMFGTALYYPAVLNHPALALLSSLPVWQVISLLGAAVLFLCYYLSSPGKRLWVFSFILSVGLLSPLPVSLYHFQGGKEHAKPSLVLLGLDTLSQADNLDPLRDWATYNNGTYYSHALTPGLLTNSVWTSILTMTPVHEHGVCFICQPYSKPQDKKDLVDEAKKAGFRTVSVFPDRSTEWQSEQAGFDENHCGPIGWRQFATSGVENASILLPVFRPIFPRLSSPGVSPNHLGTYTYSLDRELDEIFSSGSDDSRTFVAGHLTYLHAPRFPNIFELSLSEYKRVMFSKVSSIVDRSFFWQDEDLPTDAIRLHEWKINRLQNAVIESEKRTRFLERGGQLLLFSDHGNRAGITMDNFWEDRYSRVLLLTFGLPPRDPDIPVSLIDAGALLGIVPHKASSDLVVEYSACSDEEWPLLCKSANIRWDGSVGLDEKILNAIFQHLSSYHPYAHRHIEVVNQR